MSCLTMTTAEKKSKKKKSMQLDVVEGEERRLIEHLNVRQNFNVTQPKCQDHPPWLRLRRLSDRGRVFKKQKEENQGAQSTAQRKPSEL